MKKKKTIRIRIHVLANGPIKTQVKGSKKGKKGYKRSENKRIARDY